MNIKRRERKCRGFDSINCTATNAHLVSQKDYFPRDPARKLKSALINRGYEWLIPLLAHMDLVTCH